MTSLLTNQSIPPVTALTIAFLSGLGVGLLSGLLVANIVVHLAAP